LLLLLRSAHVALLDTARALVNQGHHGPAVVVAQTACEVEVEAAIFELLRRKGIEPALAEWIRTARGRSYSPKNDRIRDLWTALTADDLKTADGWSDYKGLVNRREDFVHAGTRPTEAEARAFIEAVSKLVKHVADIVGESAHGQ
jgi:hypothetical protein